tara:strand:+ start:1400 stop:1720 length:321 start_codon:yes stop_codon:yes gene_type:complete
MDKLIEQRGDLQLLLFHHGAEPRDVSKIKWMCSYLPRDQKTIFRYTSLMGRVRMQLFYVERALNEPENIELTHRVVETTKMTMEHLSRFLDRCTNQYGKAECEKQS